MITGELEDGEWGGNPAERNDSSELGGSRAAGRGYDAGIHATDRRCRTGDADAPPEGVADGTASIHAPRKTQRVPSRSYKEAMLVGHLARNVS